ncbi:MAG: 2-C-methyl-D-erythritol 4-phosphate cytidylyltransferase, partial [Candidatus Dadabacteria bacterium]
MKAAVIITAGGLGKRFVGEGAELLPKQFIPLSTKPLIVYSIQSFERSKFISEIILVVPDKWVEYTRAEIVDKFNIKKVSKVIAGGAERQ